MSDTTSDSETEADSTRDEAGDDETTSTRVRHRWTNDVLAFVLVGAHVGMLAAGLAGEVSVPSHLWTAFAVEVALATTWAFGRETLAALGEAWPFGSSS